VEAIKKPVPVLKVEDFTNHSEDKLQLSEEVSESYHDKFRKSIMDQQRDYPLPVPVISIVQNDETIPFLTLKSFSLWQGKQKSKKTTVLALAVAAFIRETAFVPGSVGFSTNMGGTVLFFDNEQGESYAARTMKLILKLAGVDNSPRLVYCDLREFPPGERKKVIAAGIECTPDVKLVVIDGLVDLLDDFMDAGEGHLTTTEILKLCSIHNIHIAGVLHQNKNDKNARAHIGTISSQKCEIEVSTEVDNEDRSQSIVSCVNSRGVPFDPFAIRWDKGSLPCIVQEWNASKASAAKSNRKFEAAKDIVQSVFKPLSALSRTDAEKGIMKAAKVSESTASRYVNNFLEWGLIDKGSDGNYRINNKQGSRVQEGSNEGS
jgi:hypothetical protein